MIHAIKAHLEGFHSLISGQRKLSATERARNFESRHINKSGTDSITHCFAVQLSFLTATSRKLWLSLRDWVARVIRQVT